MKILSTGDIIWIVMVFNITSCSPSQKSELSIKHNLCSDADLNITLQSIVFYDEKDKHLTDRGITMELNIDVVNNSTDTIQFSIDHEDYEYFNFYGIIDFKGLKDTIKFNTFQNPITKKLIPKIPIDIKLASYYYRFDMLPCYEEDSLSSLFDCFKNFRVFYKAADGYEKCVNQNNKIKVLVRN